MVVRLGIDIFNGNSAGYDMGRVASDLGPGGFVVHKASQGHIGGPGGWVDWKLQDAISRARAAGIRRVGGYHWLLHDGNPEAQADNFAHALDLIGGRARVGAFVDFERNDWNQGLNPQASDLYRFLARWQVLGGNPAIQTYAAAWYTDGYANARIDGGRLGRTNVWWPGYDGNVGGQSIQQAVRDVTPGFFSGFDGFTGYTLRQFSSSVRVAGNGSDVDYFNGSDAVLDRLFGLTDGSVPAPAPTPGAPAGWDRFNGYPTCRRGSTDASTGGKVSGLQHALNALGNHLAEDGSYGPATEAIVRVFQQHRSLAVDGVFGPVSWHWLGVALVIADAHALPRLAALQALPPDHEDRAALPETHILHPAFHYNQGEHYRDADRLAV